MDDVRAQASDPDSSSLENLEHALDVYESQQSDCCEMECVDFLAGKPRTAQLQVQNVILVVDHK